MSLSEIKLYEPQSLAKAIRLLGEFKEAHILAGGTDLFVDIKQDLIEASILGTFPRGTPFLS